MIVSKQRLVDQIFHTQLKVDTWKLSYDKEGNLTEIFGGEKVMGEVDHITYLGVIISANGTHTKDITKKRDKAQTYNEHGKAPENLYF